MKISGRREGLQRKAADFLAHVFPSPPATFSLQAVGLPKKRFFIDANFEYFT